MEGISQIYIYNRVLTPVEIFDHYENTRISYMTFLERLIYFTKITWLILIGKQKWRYLA